LLSIILNTPMFRLFLAMEKWLRKYPRLWQLLDRHIAPPPLLEESIDGHVVIVGYGRVGRHIVNLLGQMEIPHLVVDADVQRVEELTRQGVPTLFGDAANSEVLAHTGLQRARALVVAGPDEDASAVVVTAARDIAPDLCIIARATSEDGTKRLMELGAQDVIHPELEGGLEIVRHTLLQLGFPLQEIYRYTDAVRRDHYDIGLNSEEEHRLLHELIDATGHIAIRWFHIPDENPLIGQSIGDANLRDRTGASVVALLRHGDLIGNPKSMKVFQTGDRIGLIGNNEEIQKVEQLLLATKASDVKSEPKTKRSYPF